jgi:peptidoglycan hydrolase-like protein with peptidoglycan-binding domain
VIAATGAAVLLIAGGWIAAQRFVSPAQRDAAAKPPAAGPITAEVVAGALADSATAAGTFESETTTAIPIPLVGSPSVVTGSPVAPGTQVESGDVLLEVNGRPILGLTGEFPFYRDLAQGDEGPDVEQLQQALADLGYRVKVDGRFGAGTGRALEGAYKVIGYEVAEAPGGGSSAGTTPPAAIFRMSEVVVLPDESMRVTDLPSTGAVLDGESAIMASSAAIVVKAITSDVVETFVSPGSEVSLTTPSSAEVVGIVKSVERGEDDSWVVVVGASDSAFEPDWSGQETVITMTVTEAPEGSLIVPTAALVTAGASEASVLKRLPDGSFVAVRVTEVAQLSGRSAVQPVNGDLVAGDVVRIG